MSIYQRFCTEIMDRQGNLQSLSLHYPENFNFGYDVVDAIAGETPGKTALVWCNPENEERRFTFAQIKRDSDRMANVFKHAGIGRGDRVLLVLKRHYEYWFAVVALHKLGAVAVPATHMLTEKDFAYRIEAAGIKAVVCTVQDHTPEKIRAALGRRRFSVRIEGQRAPVIGDIGAAQTLVDVTDLKCSAGDTVQFDIDPAFARGLTREYR